MAKRDEILRASAKAIADRGVRGLRVTDVAQVAGVATGLIYYHFTDRDGLLAAALEYVNDRALEIRRRSSASGASTLDRLIEQFTAEFVDDEVVTENARAWNELRASAVYEASLRGPMTAASLAWTADIAQGIREAQDAGNVAAHVDAETAAVQIAVFMEGLDGRWLTGELPTDRVHELLDGFARALLSPVACRPLIQRSQAG